jgi:hypothetical protein
MIGASRECQGRDREFSSRVEEESGWSEGGKKLGFFA